MSSITNLANTTALSAVENKIPNVSTLVKKADQDDKIKEIKKCFTTSDYNKFTDNILDTKIKNKKLVNEFDISGFINNYDLNEK